jgi:hypothetical protein
MTVDDAARLKLEAYLRQIRHGLRGLPDPEAQEIVAELRSHVIDRAGGGTVTQAAVDEGLAGLGPARDLAGLYLAERMAERVEINRSPWLILKTVWRLAGLSLRALFTFMVSLVGYGLGIGLVITAVLKPFMPDNDGLWFKRTHDGFTMSLSVTTDPVGQELLGWWIIPLGLILGPAVLWLTWRFGLAGVRKLGRARAEILDRKG